MKTTKHTPGPWKVDEIYGLIMSEESEIAAVHGASGGPKEAKANAALIAAAPDLYAALEACLHDLAILASRDPENVRARRYEDAKRALARAEGRHE